MNNKEAIANYIAFMTSINTTARRIAEWAENHDDVSSDEINWGHVGSAKKILDDLQEICRFANIERED